MHIRLEAHLGFGFVGWDRGDGKSWKGRNEGDGG